MRKLAKRLTAEGLEQSKGRQRAADEDEPGDDERVWTAADVERAIFSDIAGSLPEGAKAPKKSATKVK